MSFIASKYIMWLKDKFCNPRKIRFAHHGASLIHVIIFIMVKDRKKKIRNWDESGMSIFRITSRETANGILGGFSVVLSIFLFLGTFGSFILFLSSLGLVNLLSSKGGVIGNLISKPLDTFFHIYFSTVILLAFIAISILVIFNASIKFDVISFIKKLFLKKEIAPLAPMENAAIDKAVEEARSKKQEVRIDSTIPKPRSEDEGFVPTIRRRSGKRWVPPHLSLLEGDRGKPGVGDIKAKANLIKRTLLNFGI